MADRFSASYTQVTVGVTATVDARLVKAGKLAGTITRDGAPAASTYVYTYNATTGDMATGSYGLTSRDGTFTVDSLRSQQLLVEYFSSEKRCYYGQSRWPQVPTLRTVGVTAGATTTLAMDMTKTCAAPPRSKPPTRLALR